MSSSLSNQFGSATTAGVVGYVGGMALYGSSNIKLPSGTLIPLPLLLGAGAGIGMLISNLSHDYILPALHVSERLASPVATTLNVGINFGAQSALLMALDGGGLYADMSKKKLLLESAGVVMISGWLYHRYIGPFLLGHEIKY